MTDMGQSKTNSSDEQRIEVTSLCVYFRHPLQQRKIKIKYRIYIYVFIQSYTKYLNEILYLALTSVKELEK